MDSYKRPYRGTKIYVRKKDKNDNELVKLYKKSEFSEEAKEDIDDFLDESNEIDEEDVPVKKSVKKQRKKEQEKAEKRTRAKSALGKIVASILAVAALVFCGSIFFKPYFTENITEQPQVEAATADKIYYSPLTGLESTNEKIASAEATCIMVENSTDARPQSGLTSAGIVYEAIAEGGITRFMAVYQDELPSWVGPIRSARLTFVHLSRQYNCGYVHVGGAANATSTLGGNGYRNLDGGYYEGQYVFRVSNRYAPHNVYTDAQHLKEWSDNKGWRESKFTGLKRIKPDTMIEPEKRNATSITVVMSGDDSYNASWKYDINTNKYLRSHVSGGAHMEVAKNGQQQQISTDIVIAMKASTVARPGTPYYDHTTTGSGEAFIFQNGTVRKATWRRANVTDELGFYDDENNAIELNRGHTWISIYNNTSGGRVSWK